ncbi:MAG: UDP-N-acetylmuramoyl-tripeptide--D-alanyl-D-alanine ligase [Patescibacteria group bacterium]|nr:UDP-N-acetylmuramoyl-tripeptide--D-alanyl-D-alanine ligase [Patescibacteria group bacterium]
MMKKYIQNKLEKYVRKYFAKYPDIKLIVITGSVGKTTTKVAIATVLSERFRIRLHRGNHNTHMSAPLAMLGIEYPDDIKSMKQWRAVFRAARQRIKQPADVDVIIQELGTDRVGEVPHFGTYLVPYISVVTAVSPEHMEFFHNIDTVAMEELSVANFSRLAIINRDDIDGSYSKYLTNSNINTYGTNASAEYYYANEGYTPEDGYNGKLIAPDWETPLPFNVHVLGEHMIRPVVAACAVAIKLGMTPAEVAAGSEKVRSLPGRMNVLRGADDTIIIDDSYNSSPLAAESSLRVLYQMTVPQRIAVLGSMNELGDISQTEHEALGKLCDPNQLAWVITVGDEAEKFLAPAAKARGCQVKSFKTSLQAGAFVHSVMDEGAAILFKGSQGGVFLEEAVKVILHSTSEEENLVRQSPAWMAKKTAFFSENP